MIGIWEGEGYRTTTKLHHLFINAKNKCGMKQKSHEREREGEI